MKKLINLLFVILIYGCVPSNPSPPSLVNYDIHSVITITNAPSGNYYTVLGDDVSHLNIPNGSNSITYQGDVWKFQTFPPYQLGYSLIVNYNGNQLGCADILVETFVNGTLEDTQNIQMGFTSLNPPIYCDNTISVDWDKSIYLQLN